MASPSATRATPLTPEMVARRAVPWPVPGCDRSFRTEMLASTHLNSHSVAERADRAVESPPPHPLGPFVCKLGDCGKCAKSPVLKTFVTASKLYVATKEHVANLFLQKTFDHTGNSRRVHQKETKKTYYEITLEVLQLSMNNINVSYVMHFFFFFCLSKLSSRNHHDPIPQVQPARHSTLKERRSNTTCACVLGW